MQTQGQYRNIKIATITSLSCDDIKSSKSVKQATFFYICAVPAPSGEGFSAA